MPPEEPLTMRGRLLRRLPPYLRIYVCLCLLVLVIIYTLNAIPRLLYKTVPSQHLHSNDISVNQEASLMNDLGFIDRPLLYPQSYQKVEPWPIFAVALQSKDMALFDEFIITFRKHFLKHILVVYNVDLSSEQHKLVEDRCYCQVRGMQWNRFPPHVRNLHNLAYVPILIQESLIEFGAVFWCDIRMIFTSSKITDIWTQANLHGLAVWKRQGYPTTTFTHPKMFTYLNQSMEGYYFHTMAIPVPGLYVNTKDLHTRLMYPWIRCALKERCLSPFGAEHSHCEIIKKPRYLFSGCHKFAESAFNVILGHTYHYSSPYIPSEKLFHMYSPDTETALMKFFKKITNRFKKNLKIIAGRFS